MTSQHLAEWCFFCRGSTWCQGRCRRCNQSRWFPDHPAFGRPVFVRQYALSNFLDRHQIRLPSGCQDPKGIVPEGCLVVREDPTLFSRPLAPGALAEAFGQIERHDIIVTFVLMSPVLFDDMRTWGRDIWDVEEDEDLHRTGFEGYVWGATVVTDSRLESDEAYLLGEPNSGTSLWSLQTMREQSSPPTTSSRTFRAERLEPES